MKNIIKKIESITIVLLLMATAVYAVQVITWAKEDEAIRKEAVEEYCAVLQDNPEQLALDLMQIDVKLHKNYCEDFLYKDNSGVNHSSSNSSEPSRPEKPKNPDPDFHTIDEYTRLVNHLKMNPGQMEKGVAIVKEYLSTGKTLETSESSANDTKSRQDTTSVVPHSTPTEVIPCTPEEDNN